MINWDQATKSFCFTVRDTRPETVSVLSFHATRRFGEIDGRRREPRGTAGSLLPRPVGHGVRRRLDQLQHSGGVPTARLQVLWWRIDSQRCNAPVPVWQGQNICAHSCFCIAPFQIGRCGPLRGREPGAGLQNGIGPHSLGWGELHRKGAQRVAVQQKGVAPARLHSLGGCSHSVQSGAQRPDSAFQWVWFTL